ncbi:allantoinase AllB [Amycolatopsis granulosa]|uniref:allantoinase AllB n=1 Tax=Amycolatopsis granulosa TaxID=185684 RepID=UPI0014244446|nr:allantoinase AllB [Amycolatopsis granulosa]NIH83284.1 allantoinase [Amycolatopsis granulosa]
MSERTLVIRARRTVTPSGERPAAVVVRGSVIAAVEAFDAVVPGAEEVHLAGDEVLLPGLVDSHVHVNDPGRTEWEGFRSATRAAAAGGVTTLVDMPLNSIPPTVDVAALETKRKTARDQIWTDAGFWGGAVPGNVPDLRPLHEAGVFGFKCFLSPSGVEEFGHLDRAQLDAAMREIASFGGLLIVHAEAHDAVGAAHGRDYRDFLASRPREAENRAVREVVELSGATGCRVHILHVSSAEVVPIIAQARAGGVAVTAETCPHYLTLTAEDIPPGATQFKCCPPIRERDNREQLWAALRDGVIDLVVSDHSPSTVALKRLDSGDFGEAWGGISSLQLGLPLVWTHGRARGFGLSDVVRWMAQAPAAQTGMRRKGRIEPGCDADFCVLAPDEEFVVVARSLHHRNPITPYEGQRLSGVVRSTWLRGERIDLGAPPRGRMLVRDET